MRKQMITKNDGDKVIADHIEFKINWISSKRNARWNKKRLVTPAKMRFSQIQGKGVSILTAFCQFNGYEIVKSCLKLEHGFDCDQANAYKGNQSNFIPCQLLDSLPVSFRKLYRRQMALSLFHQLEAIRIKVEQDNEIFFTDTRFCFKDYSFNKVEVCLDLKTTHSYNLFTNPFVKQQFASRCHKLYESQFTGIHGQRTLLSASPLILEEGFNDSSYGIRGQLFDNLQLKGYLKQAGEKSLNRIELQFLRTENIDKVINGASFTDCKTLQFMLESLYNHSFSIFYSLLGLNDFISDEIVLELAKEQIAKACPTNSYFLIKVLFANGKIALINPYVSRDKLYGLNALGILYKDSTTKASQKYYLLNPAFIEKIANEIRGSR